MQTLNEFDLIKKFFQKNASSRADVVLGIGDDAALLTCVPDQLLVTATDTLIEDVHFPKTTLAQDIAYKALAVNLSDLAAMGAEPLWFLLALTLPQPDEQWLQEFSRGLFELAGEFKLQLVGGDTTRGPLSITIQALGRVPPHQALLRKGAKAGDRIYVSGTLGDAGLGLEMSREKIKLSDTAQRLALQRLNRPTPRLPLGQALRGLASSAIDISDGLVADLGHILESSKVGARIQVENLPLSTVLREALPLQEAQRLALSAGDDYELCFTVPREKEAELLEKITALEPGCTCIGEIRATDGLEIVGLSGNLALAGYQHFS